MFKWLEINDDYWVKKGNNAENEAKKGAPLGLS